MRVRFILNFCDFYFPYRGLKIQQTLINISPSHLHLCCNAPLCKHYFSALSRTPRSGKQVKVSAADAALFEHIVARGAVALCVLEKVASPLLMSLCVAETERLMYSGSSPLAATGLPRATADDSFNCFQSFRLVPAQWHRVFVCMHVCYGVGVCVCPRGMCLN